MLQNGSWSKKKSKKNSADKGDGNARKTAETCCRIESQTTIKYDEINENCTKNKCGEPAFRSINQIEEF